MDRVFLARTLAATRLRVLVVTIALGVWGGFLPVIYSQFGVQFKQLVASGVIPTQFANFGGGSVFTLPGSIALGLIHPIAVVLLSVFAIGFTVASVAGERQRGTLEVILARPISRRRAYGSLVVALVGFLGLCVAGYLAGTLVSSVVFDVVDELDLGLLPLVWLNTLLLYLAFGSIGLAASVSFDRLAPALGVTLAFIVASYFVQVLGSLWPDAEPLQPLSLFHYLDPQSVLAGKGDAFDFVLLGSVALLGMAWALVVFPRRDLAAPS